MADGIIWRDLPSGGCFADIGGQRAYVRMLAKGWTWTFGAFASTRPIASKQEAIDDVVALVAALTP